MSTRQNPIGSGFDAASTAHDVVEGVDLSNKVAIVTGGYSGIGVETTRALSSAGAKVIVPARDHDKAATALKGLDGVEIETMDLLDPASVDAFAETFLASGRPLHILINSAGIMACPLSRDSRGYEMQFATNHLGHFQLVTRLWPALRQANGARVVSVSSWGHRRSPIVFDDPNFERREYDRWSAYGQSKTANILCALALDERGKAEGVRAFSLHPGSIVGTGLEKHLSREELRAFGVIDENGKPILDPAKNLKTAEQGAATSVWCATSPQLNEMGGVYCENCDIAPLLPKEDEINAAAQFSRGLRPSGGTLLGVMPYAVDPKAAERLWALSEQLLS
jgi:NAD(P)-dependent dehydrogenase (short-subunit alcohol dehydrogenase family)